MGSEFSYEDLGSREVEKYTYLYLKEEMVGERLCFVIELQPNDKKNSGYSRIISWVDKEDFRTWQEEYYDKRGKLLKSLCFAEYQLYLDFLWRAHFMGMVNHQKGKETDLRWSNFVFRTGLTDRDFDQNSLKRAK